MPERNRVDPYGAIIATPLRGSWMGNRGCIHRGRDIVRQWAMPHWIICALEYKGHVAPKWVPGRWTALFFYDEAVAFAAGHRPCALCRRQAYKEYLAAANASGAEALDRALHKERLDGRHKRLHSISWRELPAGAFVEIDNTPHLVCDDRLVAWSPSLGYGEPRARPPSGNATVLTPPTSLRAIASGYPLDVRLDFLANRG